MQWLWAVFFLLSLEKSTSSTRNKRVINGEPLNGRPLAYKVIRYYGLLGTVHGFPWYTLGFWEFLKNTGVYGSVKCSGALLSPVMVQTACHCVATFDDDGNFIRRARLVNLWEKFTSVYVGVSNRFGEESAATYSPIVAQRAVIHRQCGKLGKTDSVTHDYALVQIDSDFMKADRHTPYPWTEFESAPLYTTEQIINFHRHAMQNLLVCLYVGFGIFTRDSSDASEVLRHGWGNLVPHSQCVEQSTGGVPKEMVAEVMNWECAGKFPYHDQETGSGDSGTPITCDNRYFAVLSGRLIKRDPATKQILDAIVKPHPLVNNLYANSINYRSKLVYEFYRLEESWPRERSVGGKPCNDADGCPEKLNFKSRDIRFSVSSRAADNYHSLATYVLAVILHKMLSYFYRGYFARMYLYTVRWCIAKGEK